VYIGRPSKWGNPFSHKGNTLANVRVATREEAVDRFREYITSDAMESLRADLHELKGRTLVCWCKPQACHGDVLAELARQA
ncbi:MAG: DUF4326 domain-containing protein, partial [Anaerolineae bacterium]|nr:DUF4326 domain-containing protein [Anaerolineae bacterium]NIN95490.1 DUF4326 domain-containing protein [Anaerolineae bacterium]NIQ78474.1 DUF4326 domain-containing protein [Anaerolineae bacterium]